MNPKIEKITAEIEKLQAKQASVSSRIAELEAQKTDLENTEIVSIIRSADVPPSQLASFIRAFKERGVAPSALPAVYQPQQREVSDDAQ